MSFTTFFVPAPGKHRTNDKKSVEPLANNPQTIEVSSSSEESDSEQKTDISLIVSLPLLLAIYPHYPTFDGCGQCYNGLMINNPDGESFLNAIKADIETERGREFVAANNDHYFLEYAYNNTPSYWIDYIFIYDSSDIQLLRQSPLSGTADDKNIRIEKPIFYKLNFTDEQILTLEDWDGKMDLPITFCPRKKLTACVKNLLIEISKISAGLTLHKYDKVQPSGIRLR
ncbi:MAG: hypothetical protein V4501_09545 [Pseudomonadota bacterium]